MSQDREQERTGFEQKLQQEFNRWAAAGEGERMEHHHLDITRKAMRLMNLRPGDRVLDLGCGAGWATRLLARAVADEERSGQVAGLDVSDDMIRRAQDSSPGFANIEYVVGSAEQMPWPDNSFDRILSVESFYYYGNQRQALHELFRVASPGGGLFILINLYRDNPYSLQWVDKLKVPVHVRSALEYVEMFQEHGFENVQSMQLPDDTPTPEDYQTKSFNSLADLKAFKKIGALLLMGIKPARERGSAVPD
jgi:ubiquinone/menaquinone biosynthesis C-methylase UbiE